jgi:alkylation response protein AidB-like acyl-CoA dehydrogenase
MKVETKFSLSAEQLDEMEATRRLAADVLSPLLIARETPQVNRALVRALGEHGLIRRALPAAGEGRAVSVMALCLTREALAQESAEIETAFVLQGLGGYPLMRFGSVPARQRWVEAIRAGERVAAFALTEPDAGSDLGRIALRARRVPGGYRLNGTKKWISNAPDADVYSLFARTSDGKTSRALTAFAVPAGSDGLTGRPLRLLADHPIGEIELDDVYLPDEAVLGEAGRGFTVAMETLNLFRPSVGAFATETAQKVIDLAIEVHGACALEQAIA